MTRQRDTAELNLRASKGTTSPLLCTLRIFLHLSNLFFFFLVEHLDQVMAERNAANLRVTQLEERLAALEKEAATAKDEVVTATRRAEKAEKKELAATKQEKELTLRVAAIVNTMTDKLLHPISPFIISFFLFVC